jgi:hypothetical protein
LILFARGKAREGWFLQVGRIVYTLTFDKIEGQKLILFSDSNPKDLKISNKEFASVRDKEKGQISFSFYALMCFVFLSLSLFFKIFLLRSMVQLLFNISGICWTRSSKSF